MFSLENLAWADNLADLPLWEIGPWRSCVREQKVG